MKKNVLATLCAAVLACAIVLPAALQANVAPQAAISGDVARTTTTTTANDQAVQTDASRQDEAVVDSTGDSGSDDAPYIPGELLMILADGVTVDQLNARLPDLGYIATKHVDESDVPFDLVKVHLSDNVSVYDAAAYVAEDLSDIVSIAQPNHVYQMASAVGDDAPYAASGLQAGSIDENALSTQALAGDPFAEQQWGLKAVNAYQAWQLARVDQRVTVAVLDSGLNVNHPDLKDNVVGAYSTLNTDNPSDVTDVYGHGTHVAGIIAATVNNGEGVAGVSYNARIMPVQVANYKGGVEDEDFYNGMMEIIANKNKYNIRVVNISLGTTKNWPYNSTIMTAIANAHRANLLIVYAAGNGGTSSDDSAYVCLPCDYDTAAGALGVISLDSSLTRSSFSNFNRDNQRTKDISAPGSGILSTTIKEEGTTIEERAGASYIKNPDGSTNYNYGTNSGTSFAAPHVSGIAALLFAAYPGLTAAGVEDILKATATDLYTANNIDDEGQFDLQSGYGLVNAQAALQRAADYFPAQTSTTPSPFISGDNVVAKGSTSEGIGNTPITLSVINAGTGAWTWEVESGADNVEVTSSGNTSAIVNGKAAGSAVVTARQGSTVLKKTVYVVDPTISGPATITAENGATTQLAAPDPIVGTWEWAVFAENSSVPVSIDQTGKVSITGNMAMGDAVGKIYVSILLKTDGEESDQGSIKGTYELNFAKKPITESDVSVSDQPYANPATEPTVVVTVGDATLAKGTDYDVVFDPEYIPGTTVYAPATTVTATITGKGNYSGVVSKKFKVLSEFEQHATVTFPGGKSYTYKGSAWEPDVVVTMPGLSEPLKNNRDYHIRGYYNNVDAGTGVVVIDGDEVLHPGTITAEFTINPFSLIDQNVKVTFPDQVYTGSALTPEPTVKVTYGSTTKELKRGIDFTYTSSDYSNNTNAGFANLRIEGMGNYEDRKTFQFKIDKATLNRMTLSGGPFVYSGKMQSPDSIKVTGLDGKTIPSYDYEVVVTPSGSTNSGIYTYTARPLSRNCQGSAEAKMTIERAAVSKVVLQQSAFTYNGAVQTPSIREVRGSNGLTLKSNEYSVLYRSSSGAITLAPRLAGTYTVEVTGKGNYRSSAKATYTIKAASSGGSSGSGGSGNSGNSGNNNSGNNNSGNNSNSGFNNSGSNNNSGGSNSGNSGGSSGGNASNTITHEGPKRLYGDVALDTMRAIVDEGWSGQTGGTVVLTTLDGYWDALTAAGVAGMAKAPVLMTDTYGLSGQTESIIRTMRPSRIVVCGGSAAVSDDVALAAASASGGARIIRCWGETATGTAVSAFNNASIEGLGRWSSVALVCTNDGYWDALAAAPISYAKRMPIFLTEGRFDISNETIDAMLAGGIRAFYVIGGPAAVDDAVIAKLSGAGIEYADRLSGETAVETSEAVANFGLNWGMGCSNMGVATTNGYWDALAGAPLCGLKNSVLVLAGDSGSHSIAGFVQYHSSQIGTCYVFGGEAALDATTYQAIQYAIS